MAEELYDDFLDNMKTQVVQRVSDGDLVQDIVDEAFLRLWIKNRPVSCSWEIVRSWQTAIKNLCKNLDRLKKNESKRIRYPGELPEVEAPLPTPREMLEEKQTREDLQQLIQSLPQKDREMIERYVNEEN